MAVFLPSGLFPEHNTSLLHSDVTVQIFIWTGVILHSVFSGCCDLQECFPTLTENPTPETRVCATSHSRVLLKYA